MALSELGAFLQRHREERGWSLEDAEEMTHIRRHYLVAMEEGDWDSLPPAVYTRGLLRNYARALGVSQASVMRMHVKERPHEARLPEPQLISQPLVVTPRFNFELLAALALLLISAGLIAWVVRSQLPGVLQQVRATDDDSGVPAVVVDPATAAPTTETPTPLPTRPPMRSAPVVAGETVTATRGSGSTAVGPGDGTAEEAVVGVSAGTADGAATGTVSSAGGRTGTPAAAARTGTATQAPTAGPSPTATINVAGSKLVMEAAATSDAWIQVYTDGSLAYRGFLRKGDTMQWAANDRVGLRTGNAGGTIVTLNGQALDSLGGNGEVIEFEWRMLPSGDVEQRRL